MKKLMMLAALALLSAGVMAQDKKDKDKDRDKKDKKEFTLQNTDDTSGVWCAELRGDNMVISGENENKIVDSKKLPNGTVLYSDGVMKRKDGSYYLLKEGECVNKSGDVVHNESDKPGGE